MIHIHREQDRITHNWYPSKVHFRANVKRYAITLAQKCTFDGHQLWVIRCCSRWIWIIEALRNYDVIPRVSISFSNEWCSMVEPDSENFDRNFCFMQRNILVISYWTRFEAGFDSRYTRRKNNGIMSLFEYK